MDVDDAFGAAGTSGADDAPSTSQQQPDQQLDDGFDAGGEFQDEFEDAEPASDFQQLKKALLNERLAPEILAYQGDLVDRVRERIEQQEREIDRLERDPDGDVAQEALSLERDRLRWLLKSYLRTRLGKVQQYAALVLRDAAGVQARVSPQELKFANDYFMSLGQLYQDQVLQHLPPNYNSLLRRFNGDQSQALVEEPDTDVFVFCKVDRDCGQIPDGPNGETADVNAGDILNIRYKHIAHLVQGGQVHLI
ncbi:DNA replication complex GINS [Raphidocelis subcapitata]|uniref:DNA replication complex GINS protein SLD5 n=1 Tax=Raphidocelis subcapitata TaxID=307507 RepID=A0A2V0P6Y3_9CHLO|nr:DNA replication complex GINS [Raphidocelis subcapitata]|eukprot:GBF95329.1 DNA replication complex GINS [Raphidocelis subcapitata]